MSQKSDGQEKQERNQGIRIALDRMIRQAIARTISDIYKEVFGDNSYGFRPGRSCHNAIRQPTDTTTLIPFLKETEEYLTFKYQKIIADAGYESEENYVFLDQNQQLAFIKPSNYEISKKRKYRNDIGGIENMKYDEKSDSYICKNGKQLPFTHLRRSKSKTGYISEKNIYQCKECKDCPYKKECIKGNNCKTPIEERNKVLSVAKTFLKYREEDLERILSDEGILLRINRSIQAEGSFGELKQDMQFRRYLSRGTANVLAESVLLAMAKNVNKLHNKIQKGKTGRHLFPLKSA